MLIKAWRGVGPGKAAEAGWLGFKSVSAAATTCQAAAAMRPSPKTFLGERRGPFQPDQSSFSSRERALAREVLSQSKTLEESGAGRIELLPSSSAFIFSRAAR